MFHFFPNGRAYDFRSKFQISSKIVYGEIEPGNDVWWCFRVKSKCFFQYVKMWNFSTRHLGFFPKGLAYDFGSNFSIFSKCMCGQNGRGSDVWWRWRLLTRSWWLYLEMINLASGYVSLFSKGESLRFWVKISSFFKLCIWSNVTWKWCLLMF